MVGRRARTLNDQAGAIDTLAWSVGSIHVYLEGVITLCLCHVGDGVDKERKEIRLTVDIKFLVDRLSVTTDGLQ